MSAYEGNEPYLFISYSHKDKDALDEIARFLDENHVRYWFDSGLHSGDDWNDVIAEHLRYAEACLLLLSPDSATSKYVKNELTFAINFEIPVHTLQIKTYVDADIKELPLDIVMALGRLQMLKMQGNYREKLLCGLPAKVIASQAKKPSEGLEFAPSKDGKSYTLFDSEICPAKHTGKSSTGLEFSLNTGGKSYSLSGLGTCADKHIIIPPTYNGVPDRKSVV